MKKINLLKLVLSSVICASLAACGGEPVEDGQVSLSGEAAEDGISAPDTQGTGAVDQAQKTAKLHIKAEGGTEADFLLPDGAAVKVTNEQLGVAYRLTGQVIDAEHLIITVEQFNDIELKSLNSTDVLYLEQGRESVEQSAITPFSLRMLGLEDQSVSGPTNNAKVVGDDALGHCCVPCGGWQVCCTPTKGHCCKVTSSCGNSCIACN